MTTPNVSNQMAVQRFGGRVHFSYTPLPVVAASMADPSVANELRLGVYSELNQQIRWAVLADDPTVAYKVGLYRWVGSYDTSGVLKVGGRWVLDTTVTVAAGDWTGLQYGDGDPVMARIYDLVGGTVQVFYKGVNKGA